MLFQKAADSCMLNELLECSAYAQMDCLASTTVDECRINLTPPNTAFDLSHDSSTV